ncbi:PREDICTED: uncharacterized protein LOC109582886 [Amphimedon queenslandica]|nr:PREDICTED: uncharacterized protein LOC109582886 [Amphimedon queenslandica]|eukprot:XP_019853493.1 PREDICTED: uncharacterized protein LOC109582886 [Amphimedon queenslandica]
MDTTDMDQVNGLPSRQGVPVNNPDDGLYGHDGDGDGDGDDGVADTIPVRVDEREERREPREEVVVVGDDVADDDDDDTERDGVHPVRSHTTFERLIQLVQDPGTQESDVLQILRSNPELTATLCSHSHNLIIAGLRDSVQNKPWALVSQHINSLVNQPIEINECFKLIRELEISLISGSNDGCEDQLKYIAPLLRNAPPNNTALNMPIHNGETLLHLATRYLVHELILSLIDCGASPTIPISGTNTSRNTSLHIASLVCDMLTVSRFISAADNEAECSRVNNKGETALHCLIKAKEPDEISDLPQELLLKFDPSIQSEEGDTVLHLAMRKDQHHLLSKLLMHPKAPESVLLLNNENECVLDLLVEECLSSGKDYLTCLGLLFEREATHSWQPVNRHLMEIKRNLLSPKESNESLLVVLLKHPFILQSAFDNNENSIFEILMTRFLDSPTLSVALVLLLLFRHQGSNYYFEGKQGIIHILWAALEDDNFILFKTLLQHHLCLLTTTLDDFDNTLLHFSVAKKGIPEGCLSFLFSHPLADPNFQNREGNTALHVACDLGNALAASIMATNKDLNLNLRNNNNKTALMLMLERCKRLSDFTIPSEMICVFPSLIREGDNMLHVASRMTYEHDFALDILTPSEDLVLKQAYQEQNSKGETPLYIALETCMFKKAEILLESYNPHRRTLLHQVCLYPSLFPSCLSLLEDPKYRGAIRALDKNGDTSLHVAMKHNFLKAQEHLINLDRGLVTIKNKAGQTPLHLACHSRNLNAVDIILSHCPPDIVGACDEDNWLPLHCACQIGDENLVKTLLEKDANPVVSLRTENIDGDTPFHLLCTVSADLVDFILTRFEDLRGMLEAKDRAGNTPFHLVLKLGSSKEVSKAMESLLKYRDTVPMTPNRAGCTVFHDSLKETFDDPFKIMLRRCPNQLKCSEIAELCRYAMQFEPPRLVKLHCLLAYHEKDHADGSKCESLNIGKTERSGLIHSVIAINEPDLTRNLVEKFHVDPLSKDREGNTSLHIACRYGGIEVAKYLLSHWSFDLKEANAHGETPLSLATSNFSMLSLLNKFQNLSRFKEQYPMDSFCKVFVTGHSGAGKTTFIEVFKSFLGSKGALTRLMRRFQTVAPVQPFTAGIIPTTISGEGVGNLVIYDLAGHFEYHSSHSAILEHLILSSSPLFVLLINLSKSVEEVKQQLLYWLNLLQNQSYQLPQPSPVIIIGSHEDEAKNKTDKIKIINNFFASEDYPSLRIARFVPMDCRVLSSKRLTDLQDCFSTTCSEIVSLAPKVSLLCHGLYDYLTTKIEDEILALTLGDLSKHLLDKEEEFLPTDSSSLTELSSTLSDKGLILFLKNPSDLDKSWIVIQREALLSQVNGLVFAPENFTDHLPLNNSTGLIPKSYLSTAFPQYETDMLIEFLVHFEFCHLFNENSFEILREADTPPDNPENLLLFFPALIKNEPPSKCWPPEDSASSQYNWFSWILQCTNETQQFFTYRFMHVLILRLALSFALPPANEEGSSLPVLRRRCSIWRSGLRWMSDDGMWVMVHFTNNNKTLQLVMASPIGQCLSVVRYRSKVIATILNAKEKFCKGLQCYDVFQSPQWALLPTGEEFKLSRSKRGVFRLIEISQRIINQRDPDEPCIITDVSGTCNISTKDLFLFEVYNGFSTSVLQTLFQPASQEDLVSDDFILELTEAMRCIRSEYNPLKIATSILGLPERRANEFIRRDNSDFDNCVSVLKLWIKDSDVPSYRNLRTCFDELSVFAGRNPLDLAAIKDTCRVESR